VRQHKATKAAASTEHLSALSRVILGSTRIVGNVVGDHVSGPNTHVFAKAFNLSVSETRIASHWTIGLEINTVWNQMPKHDIIMAMPKLLRCARSCTTLLSSIPNAELPVPWARRQSKAGLSDYCGNCFTADEMKCAPRRM
jgi:hypothetical protein